jgi:hypothetical protein
MGKVFICLLCQFCSHLPEAMAGRAHNSDPDCKTSLWLMQCLCGGRNVTALHSVMHKIVNGRNLLLKGLAGMLGRYEVVT